MPRAQRIILKLPAFYMKGIISTTAKYASYLIDSKLSIIFLILYESQVLRPALP